MTAHTFRPGFLYLGWQYAPRHTDPGPPPQPPVPADPERLDPGWLAAQRREESRLSRPATVAACVCLVLAVGVLLSGRAGLNPALSGLGTVGFGALAVVSARAAWRGRQSLHADIAAETRRVAAARAAAESELAASQQEHTRRFGDWQGREQAFSQQPLWHPVVLPATIDRVDVAGGTLAGWSALLTSFTVPRLVSGGEITVLDLSEGAVARDLVTLAAGVAIDPLVWVLPADLPRFDLGAGLPAGALADVLATSAAAGRAGASGHDPARDHALLDRLLGVLGDGARISQVTAALRALGQVGDPRADVRDGQLTAAQLDRITGLFGRAAADRVVIEHAWALEARLRVLEVLGADPAPLPRSRLRVVALDASGGMFGNEVTGTYVAVSLTFLLRHASPRRPWHHTLCVAGAEKLAATVLDRLVSACETTRTGLLLAYRSMSPEVRERLGRGNAALAVMRLGNSGDAQAAAEQIGTQHRFVLSQLTDTVGASVSDTVGDSYTSTVGAAGSWATSVSRSETSGYSRGRGHSTTGAAAFAPRTGSGSREVSQSRGTSDSESISEGINTSTAWGISTSRAVGRSDSLSAAAQRSREFLVEPHELQRLPPSAAIVSYASPAGRQVVLADTNPAILTLPNATSATAGGATTGGATAGGATTGGPAPPA
jgi:hypothetical protein